MPKYLENQFWCKVLTNISIFVLRRRRREIIKVYVGCIFKKGNSDFSVKGTDDVKNCFTFLWDLKGYVISGFFVASLWGWQLSKVVEETRSVVQNNLPIMTNCDMSEWVSPNDKKMTEYWCQNIMLTTLHICDFYLALITMYTVRVSTRQLKTSQWFREQIKYHLDILSSSYEQYKMLSCVSVYLA